METLSTAHPAPALPEDLPEGVQLLDERWLADQKDHGARLTLVEPAELKRVDGAADALRAELARAQRDRDAVQAELEGARSELEQLQRRHATEHSVNTALLATVAELERRGEKSARTIRSLDSQLRSSQEEARELQRELALAQRPLWRKLLNR